MNHRIVAALVWVAGAGLLQPPAQRASAAPQLRTIVVYKSPT